jgi:hypothetical protein
MLVKDEDIPKIVRELAAEEFPPGSVDDVLCEPTVDLDGRDAFEITVVLVPEREPELTGEQTLGLQYRTRQYLLKRGDDRFPFIDFTTTDELKEMAESENDDDES